MGYRYSIFISTWAKLGLAQPAICLAQPAMCKGKVKRWHSLAQLAICKGKVMGVAQPAICSAQAAICKGKVRGWHSQLYACHSQLYGGGPGHYTVSFLQAHY